MAGSAMTGLKSTGALWLDVTLLGSSFLMILPLSLVVLLTNPQELLDPNFRAFVLGFTIVGIGIIALGVGVGRRTRWKVPDPEKAETK